jgi:hypothetical protein
MKSPRFGDVFIGDPGSDGRPGSVVIFLHESSQSKVEPFARMFMGFALHIHEDDLTGDPEDDQLLTPTPDWACTQDRGRWVRR